MRRNVACAVLLSVLFSAVSPAREARDTIILRRRGRSGAPEKVIGRVKEDNADKVVIRIMGATMSYSQDEVEEVIYDGGKPTEYHFGRARLVAGACEEALELLGRAQRMKHHPLLTQYIIYYTGKANLALPDTEAAVQAFSKLLAMGRKTRFYVEAAWGLAELHMRKKEFPAAERVVDSIKPKTRAERMRVLQLKEVLAEKQGNFEKALKICTDWARQVKSDSPEGVRASVAKARCHVALKRPEEAARDLRRLVSEGKIPAPELYAEAYVVLGDALSARATEPELIEEAIMAYMRVPALYSEEKELEAEALFKAARLFQRLPGEENRRSARRLLKELRSCHPESEYARKL